MARKADTDAVTTGCFDRRTAAKIIVDAMTSTHAEAAERWNVSTKTISRYVARLEAGDDAVLTRLVQEAGQKRDRVSDLKRRRSLDIVEAKMVALCEEAGVDNLKDLVEAYKALRDTEMAAKYLNVSDGPGLEASEDEADAGPASHGQGREGGDGTGVEPTQLS